MIDDQNSKNSSTFSLFSKKELEHQTYINEVNLLVEKYNILENENQLIGSTDKNFLYLIDYINSLNKNNQSIPQDITTLFLENIFLKEQINDFLEKNLNNITKNSSIDFFKEITLILFILSIGTKEKILDIDFNYNYNAISNLFRFYENHLKDLHKNNSTLFVLTFNSYTILLKTFIQICKINSIDLQKTKNIHNILELITETINKVKFSILLEKVFLEKLTSIQGKYLFYFSHLEDFDINTNNLDNSIEKYFLSFEKQIAGYTIYNANIQENDNSNFNEFLILKNYSSILILKLIEKLKEKLKVDEYFNTDNFQRILRLYYKTFYNGFNKLEIPSSIEIFEKNLLNSFLYDYNINLNFNKKVDHHTIIEDFIILEKDFDSSNLETIYNILKFSPDIKDFKYYAIADILVDTNQIANDYQEFYKLMIFNLIINKTQNSNKKIEIEILDRIFYYITNIEVKYQFISIFTKLYLDLSYFYSFKMIYLNKSKKLFYLYLNIKKEHCIIDNYLNIENSIISNIKIHEPNFDQNKLVKEFLIAKSLELHSNVYNKQNNDIEIKKIISGFISDDNDEIDY